jgi:5,10-methylenetetrahydrofolate reductase
MTGASLELFVPSNLNVFQKHRQRWIDALKNTSLSHISLTRGTGKNYCIHQHHDMIDLLKDWFPGIDIVSHVTLSHLEEQTMDGLRKRGIRSVLALAGDAEISPLAEKKHLKLGLDFIRYLNEYHKGEFTVHGSAYPGGHLRDLHKGSRYFTAVDKMAAGASSLVTQLVISVDTVIEFANNLNALLEQFQVKARTSDFLLAGYMPLVDADQTERLVERCKMCVTEHDTKEIERIRSLGEKYDWEAKCREDSKILKESGLFRNIHYYGINRVDLVESMLKIHSEI